MTPYLSLPTKPSLITVIDIRHVRQSFDPYHQVVSLKAFDL